MPGDAGRRGASRGTWIGIRRGRAQRGGHHGGSVVCGHVRREVCGLLVGEREGQSFSGDSGRGKGDRGE